MRVFAISDLHLSHSGAKPMDVFGPEWADHPAKIATRWRETVGEDDIVLVPGDLSWAMRLDEARPDLDYIEALPGTKYILRGNHDYWFATPAKVRAVLGATTRLVRFDAHVDRGVGICGVRSWPWPGHPEFDPERDEKHWRRAVMRLEMSLAALGRLDWDVAVAMFHYPPLGRGHTTELCDMVREAGVTRVVYGHLHGSGLTEAFEGERDGVVYQCVSADRVEFRPALILDRD